MYQRIIKRIADIIFSIIILPVEVMIFVIIAPSIHFEDKGPVFYRAPRIGENGKVFLMYKYRSMKINSPDIRNADGSTYNNLEDERLTRVGKFIRKTSIDELPQFLNVLKGDMSVIGPRPDLPDALGMYTDKEKEKLGVKPGITGYNQAYFRNSVDMEKRWENDVYYANNISFIFDLKIFFKTVIRVLSRKDICK